MARLRLGEDPITATQRVKGLPSHVEQFVRFSTNGPSASEPLRSIAQVLEERAKLLSQAALPILEPAMLILAFLSVLLVAVATFLPLIKLLNDLS